MSKPVPFAMPPWPFFDDDDVRVVNEVLRTGKVNYWTGSEGRTFEKEFASHSGSAFGVAVSNGTVALELCLHVLGVGPGDEVVVTPRTFIGSASPIVQVGAIPVMADVCPESQNITPETVRAVLNERTKAVIAVHLAGWPCEMDGLNALCHEKGIRVIEDCAQAHGARYRGRPVGSLGSMAALSFCQDKIITTGGEGGIVLTDNEAWWRAAWEFKDHGKSFAAVYEQEHPPGFRWLHESFGTNWRMTELQSALGRRGLSHLPEWVEQRRRNAQKLFSSLGKFPELLRIPVVPDHIDHSYYRAYAFVRPERSSDGISRDRLMDEICSTGVPCFSGSCSEIYLEKAFRNHGYEPVTRLPVAKELGETSLCFLTHPTITDQCMSEICERIEDVLSKFSV